MIRKIIATLFAALVLNSSIGALSYAAVSEKDQYVKYNIQGGDLGFIDIQGAIGKKTARVSKQAFAEFKKNNLKEVIIHLNSPGGLYESGMDIVELVLDAQDEGVKVMMFVDHGDICMSMCTGIFAVADVRMATADSVWMFHSPFVDLTDKDKENKKLMEYIERQKFYCRDILFRLYHLAAPTWSEEVLHEYVWNDGKELRLTGEEIWKQTPDWINHRIVD